jgi:hypothetical protein
MSLYGDVTSKQDLLDGVLERIYDEVPLTVMQGLPWSDRLRLTATLVREVLLRHPNMVALAAARPVTKRCRLALVETAELEIQRAGLSPEQAAEAVAVVASFTIGHVANEVGAGQRARRDAEFDLGIDFIISGVQRLVDGSVVPTS